MERNEEAKATFGAKTIPYMINIEDGKKGGESSNIRDGKKNKKRITTTIKRTILRNQDENKMDKQEGSNKLESSEGGNKWVFGKGLKSKELNLICMVYFRASISFKRRLKLSKYINL